jgi:hypothetical protein
VPVDLSLSQVQAAMKVAGLGQASKEIQKLFNHNVYDHNWLHQRLRRQAKATGRAVPGQSSP